jgi:sirohydrochlorin cobaltochelatase
VRYSIAMKKSKSAYVVIAHGSRDQEANLAFGDFLKRFRTVLGKKTVEGAFLELTRPSIPEALESCIRKGADQIFVLPLMFFPGRHVKQDIPRMVQEAKLKYPHVDFHYGGPLAGHPMMTRLLKDKAQRLKRRTR